jgi:hypothetical protein
MRRRLILVVNIAVLAGVAALGGGCTMWKEPKVSTWKNTTSVEAMERLLWKEVAAQNWVEVEAHLASNFTYSTHEGVYDKAQTLERLKKSSYDYMLGEFNVSDSGETTVASYRVVMTPTGAVAGIAPKPQERRRMAVWQKQKSGWAMIALADADLAGHFNIP